MTRPFNFSAGPSTLPEAVLHQAAAEITDWHGQGLGIMEMSHRSSAFLGVLAQTEADLRQLLQVPADFHILFLQGGALGQNAFVPMNLAGRQAGRVMDFVLTGYWSRKSQEEARRYGQVHTAVDVPPGTDDHPLEIPPAARWTLSDDAAYVHLCSNETIDGVEFHTLPDLAALGCDAPLVIDCSSHIASRPVDWSRVGLAFAGAQKNIGPSGLTLVFVRDDLLGHALDICPSAFNYRSIIDRQGLYNTPSTWCIYMAGLVFQWILAQRVSTPQGELQGLAAMEHLNIQKSQLLYQHIDASGGFYRNRIHPAHRSRMNVPFVLHDPRLDAPFLAGAQARGLLSLKGHAAVGGLRASLYNAMPLAGVQALCDYLNEFAQLHG